MTQSDQQATFLMRPSPLIVLSGTPPWADAVKFLLERAGFETIQYLHPAHLIDRLVDDYPVLLVVDGDQSDWTAWVNTPKTEQATRRIPILVIAHHAARQSEAVNAGADGYLTVAQLTAGLLDEVRRIARLPDSELLDTLDCQCQQELPPLAQQAVREFNAGAYYVQHDYFEKLWMAEAGPVRDLYRAALQVGVAYYHITRGNHAGALRMLMRSRQWFALLPDVCQGIDVRRLREDANRVRAAIHALSAAENDSIDHSLLQPIHLVSNSSAED
jgi:hypothetical protein